MEPSNWEKMQTLFEAALALPESQRNAYLQQQDASESVIQEVRSLLGADKSCENLWQSSRTNPTTPTTNSVNKNELTTGQLIGPYQIEDKIGAGGMGVIYRAKDTRLGRQVALKFLLSSVQKDDVARQRFLIEARSASQLDHRNICAIYDIGKTDDNLVYITLPFYKGETLATKIARGAIDLNEALDIVTQISDGLVNAHTVNIVHRDIKPANIMLTNDNQVKILDFGIAKMANINLTEPGMSVGTVAYMAPEQFKGEGIDARVDIWALGITFFEMLTGKRAFANKNMQQDIKQIINGQHELIDSLPDNIPLSIRAVLSKALQKNRGERYTNMATLHDDLKQAQASMQDTPAKKHTKNLNMDKERYTNYQWDDVFLVAVTEILLPWLGPITPKLVQRYAKVSATLDSFLDKLTGTLPDESSCKPFVEKFKIIAAHNPKPLTADHN
ncbi:hypothetical protein MNBD_GAMMA23-93 [hydrothermal vent metagenome]|uniref:Protein kinase domain-containing protein n=1 Tax=hydrothermal vent metagenome TaxID=652676 RepID=A0A3B0ZRY5_9ZZZZ